MMSERLWERKWHMGAPPKYKDPMKLLEDCKGYFQWLEDNPLWEAKAFSYQGETKIENLPKMRAATIRGLCLYLGIHHDTWYDWKVNRPDLSDIIARVDDAIHEQKFTGAAAELLNPNIIARDLGLADKAEISGNDGGPIEVHSNVDKAKAIAFFLEEAAREKT